MEAQSENTPNSSLPLILVSAYDLASANALISEITNNPIKDTRESRQTQTQSCVWQIVNKYYQVDVELYPVADGDALPPSLAERFEAHIIYITEDEEGDLGAERAEQRWARAGAGAAREGVRLAAAAGARAAPALAAWARRRRYEPVALREAPDDDDDVPDTYGAERVRAALHAHTWRGLRRLDAPARNFLPLDPTGATSSDEEYEGGGSEDEGEGEGAVERAEAFAEALGALGGALPAGALPAGALPDAARRRRAERLVAAFCRALGADLPAL